jgi:hypothetical protein
VQPRFAYVQMPLLNVAYTRMGGVRTVSARARARMGMIARYVGGFEPSDG